VNAGVWIVLLALAIHNGISAVELKHSGYCQVGFTNLHFSLDSEKCEHHTNTR